MCSKVESSKAVSHLPMSSQLEYHRLLNRMKLLEKQKEQKSRLNMQQPVAKVNSTQSAKNESNFPSLTVVVQNDNRFIQTNKSMDMENDAKVDELPKMPLALKTQMSKIPSTISNTSLAKKVLMKNAMAQATDSSLKSSSSSPVKATEQSTNNEKNLTNETKPLSMTLEMFSKKTPKAKATMLANYVKRYKNHGFVLHSSFSSSFF